MELNIPYKWKSKESRVVTLRSDKIDFISKAVVYSKVNIMIKVSSQKEEIYIYIYMHLIFMNPNI